MWRWTQLIRSFSQQYHSLRSFWSTWRSCNCRWSSWTYPWKRRLSWKAEYQEHTLFLHMRRFSQGLPPCFPFPTFRRWSGSTAPSRWSWTQGRASLFSKAARSSNRKAKSSLFPECQYEADVWWAMGSSKRPLPDAPWKEVETYCMIDRPSRGPHLSYFQCFSICNECSRRLCL